jgi:hypothetical protein
MKKRTQSIVGVAVLLLVFISLSCLLEWRGGGFDERHSIRQIATDLAGGMIAIYIVCAPIPFILTVIAIKPIEYAIRRADRKRRNSRFAISKDRELVFDIETGLTWQRHPPIERCTHNDALAFASTLQFHGRGWRLPTRGELLGLYQFDDDGENPLLNREVFPYTQDRDGDHYWTEGDTTGQKNACAINLGGYDYAEGTFDKSTMLRAWAVR